MTQKDPDGPTSTVVPNTPASGTVVTPPSPAAPVQPAPENVASTPKAPDKYDLKLSDGSLLDSSRLEKIAAEARKRGLSNEAAQELVNHEEQAVAAHVEQAKAVAAKWVDDAKADEELGGKGDAATFTQNVELAKRAVEKFGSTAFREALEQTGLGNHPEVLRTFLRIGRAMADDPLVSGSATPAKPQKTLAQRMYPSHT